MRKEDSRIRSIIHNPAVATELLAERELLHLVTHVLAGLQSANAQRRHLGRHVEYESRAWQYAFILEFEVMGVLKPVLRAFSDVGAPRHLARGLQLRCAQLMQRWALGAESGVVAFAAEDGASFSALADYQVSRDAVSFHLPLHRCMSAFVFEQLYRRRDEEGCSLQEVWCLDELPPFFAAFLVDSPLRVQVLCSQIEHGSWVRNGALTMAHQVPRRFRLPVI